MNRDQTGWRWLFLLAALEAGAALFVLARIPTGTGGYTLARWLLLVALAALFVVAAFLSWRPPRWLDGLVRPSGIICFALLSFVCAITLFLLRYLDPQALAPIYARLGIFLWYGLVVGSQTAIFLLFSRFSIHPAPLGQLRPSLRPFGIAFGTLLLVAILIAITRLGLKPDPAYWGEPGVPILGWQLALALVVGAFVLVLSLIVPSTDRLDPWLAIGLWFAATILWLSVPLSVMRNSFYAPMSPPTLEAYPNSDAGYYDSMAESALIGYAYLGDIPTRPLFVALLAGLHFLVGERYELIVAGQTLLLATIPALLYLLAKALHSRVAGVLIGVIAIFRELTSLWVSSETRVSNTKTLLVDLPTLLLLVAACLLVVRWLDRKDVRRAAIAGGMFGLVLLLRTQALVILPLILLVVLLCYRIRISTSAAALAWFACGLGLAVLPWLVHNYIASGHFAFDAPFQYDIIASQYRYTGNLDINTVDLQGQSLPGIMLAFLVRDPKYVLGFIASHSIATQIDGLLALPLIEPFSGLRAPINMYWLSWNGNLSWFNVLLVLVYLALISLGLGAAWRRHGWVGLTPLAFSLGYSVSNGLGRFSGWRYDLPADWMPYFYAGLGVAEVMVFIALLLGSDSRRLLGSVASDPKSGPATPRMVLALSGFVLLGISPWLAQGMSAPRYAGQSTGALLNELAASRSVQRLGVSEDQVNALLNSPGGTLEIGRLLYPRFFTRGLGLASTHPWPAYAPREFPRLGFVLLNQGRHDVVFPTRQSPEGLLHGSDVIVLGCEGQDYIDARLILVPDSGLAFMNAPLDAICP